MTSHFLAKIGASLQTR